MRCIEACGYNTKPDNLNLLKAHLEECLAKGACKTLKKNPSVVWKDGEFVVVEKTTKKDRVFPIELAKRESVELTPELIKTGREVARAKKKPPTVTMKAAKKKPSESDKG